MLNAALYSSANDLQKQGVTAVLPHVISSMTWSDDDAVLDIGCGSGDVTNTILLPCIPRFSKLVAVDKSSVMLDFAKGRYPDERVTYREMDIENCLEPRKEFPEGFDKVFSFYCLHWVEDMGKAAACIHELLKTGGETMLMLVVRSGISLMYSRMAGKSEWQKYVAKVEKVTFSKYQHSENPADKFAAVLEDAGLDIIECKQQYISFTHSNMNSLRKMIESIDPFHSNIPDHLRDQYLDECMQEVLSMCTVTDDGSIIDNYKIVVAYAKKT